MAVAVVRLLSELWLLAGAFVVWLGLVDGWASWLAAILLALAVAVIWGLWIAPKAKSRLTDPGRLILEIVLFIGVGGAVAYRASVLWGLGLAVVGTVFAVLARRSSVPM